VVLWVEERVWDVVWGWVGGLDRTSKRGGDDADDDGGREAARRASVSGLAATTPTQLRRYDAGLPVCVV
jgi:hypothetical protein